MTEPHVCDYWSNGQGGLECACGQSLRPTPEISKEENHQ